MAQKGSMTRRHSARWRFGHVMERFSEAVTRWTGGTTAFVFALGVIVGWLVLGPIFRFSDTWQLVINTATTIITFLMVFLIQRAQNKEGRAVALKLNELIAALEGASNRLIDVESLGEDELEVLRSHFHTLSKLAGRDQSLLTSHSIEEATTRHESKLPARKPGTRRPRSAG